MQSFDISKSIIAGSSKTRLDPWMNASDFTYYVLYGSRYIVRSAGFGRPAMSRAMDVE